MGDPALADPSLIVDYEPLHDPAWRGMPAYMHYDANWLLIVDNLSDFAHLAFVHTKTLGGSEEYAYQTRPLNIERLADGFRVERWHMNSDPPPFHKKVIADKTAKVDRRNIGRMLVPGIFFLESMFAPAGTGAEKGNIAGARQYRNCQFMTPETRRTTHFFWNYLHNFDLDDPNIALSLCNSLREGFMEDKAIIEAQQKLFDREPDTTLLAIAADAPLAHFRRVFGQRLAAEQGSGGRGGLNAESVDRRQELAQHVGVDGLLQVVVDAGEGVGDALVVVLAAGDGDQDDVVAVAAAQRSRQLVAVHSRHADVEQHAVRLVRLDERERAGAVGRDPDLVAAHRQRLGERFGGVDEVVDHHHPDVVVAHREVLNAGRSGCRADRRRPRASSGASARARRARRPSGALRRP